MRGLAIYLLLWSVTAKKKFISWHVADSTYRFSTGKIARSTIECGTMCIEKTDCYGFGYNEPTYKCYLLEPANACSVGEGTTQAYFHISKLLARGMYDTCLCSTQIIMMNSQGEVWL